uniref:Uncharacterized protein n=1 Tax=Dendroctonus ponderosae TaxID=77166 RepID=A0AAR5PX34_DENPD
MSVLVEPCSGPIWRKRPFKGLDGPDVKRSRVAQLQLEPERPRSSDEDTESVSSIQEKETDYVKDASEPESQTSVQSSTDEYEVEVAYEVESNGNSSDISSPESDMMVAVAAAMICNKPLDAWLTDAEASYSDSSTSLDEIAFRRQEFTTCLLCKTKNPNPLYRYCEQCFQVDIDSFRHFIVDLLGERLTGLANRASNGRTLNELPCRSIGQRLRL